MIAMDLGEVIAQGDPNEVVHDPRVVASYLGNDEAAIARSGGRGPAPPDRGNHMEPTNRRETGTGRAP